MDFLKTALRIGITEHEFWDMTIGEVQRRVEAYNENKKEAMQREASFNYDLAAMIGMYVSKCLGSKSQIPQLYEMYPTLFDNPEVTLQDKRSVANFLQFAQRFNAKYKQGETKNNE